MKTWKWLVIVLVIALVAVYYVLGMDYLKLRRQNIDATSQIEVSKVALAHIPATPPDLEQRLSDAKAELAATENSFAGGTDDTLMVNDVLELADQAGIKAVPLDTRPWAVEHLFNRDYNVFSLTLSLTGDFTNLQYFVEQLENNRTDKLVIRDLKVEKSPGANSENITADSENITADIEVAVYTLITAVE